MPRATHLSKILQVSVAGAGLFYLFFCAVRKMALVWRNARNLSTSGDISDRSGTSDFTLKHIGRFEDAKL